MVHTHLSSHLDLSRAWDPKSQAAKLSLGTAGVCGEEQPCCRFGKDCFDFVLFCYNVDILPNSGQLCLWVK